MLFEGQRAVMAPRHSEHLCRLTESYAQQLIQQFQILTPYQFIPPMPIILLVDLTSGSDPDRAFNAMSCALLEKLRQVLARLGGDLFVRVPRANGIVHRMVCLTTRVRNISDGYAVVEDWLDYSSFTEESAKRHPRRCTTWEELREQTDLLARLSISAQSWLRGGSVLSNPPASRSWGVEVAARKLRRRTRSVVLLLLVLVRSFFQT